MVLFGFVLGAGCSTPSDTETNEENLFVYQNGWLLFEENSNYETYQVYVQDKLFATTENNEYDVARAIVESKPIPYGTWNVEVVGVAANGVANKQSAQAFSFEIKELNGANFASALNGDYAETDYFLISEDICLYGQGKYNSKTVDGYQTVSLGAPVAESACFFIDKPFTATLDGNGYRLDVLVDEHISWVELPFVFGGVFYNIAPSGVVKNTQIFLDLKYENKSRPDSSAGFAYQFNGTIADCFMSGVFKPFVRLSLEECRLQQIPYDNAPYLDSEDAKVALVAKANDGAAIENTVFQVSVFALDGTEKTGGGAVAFNAQNTTYRNCVLIARGEERFFNNGHLSANAKSQTPRVANGIYFYQDFDAFLALQGYQVLGELLRTPQYTPFEGNALEGLTRWKTEGGELYLLDNPIIV